MKHFITFIALILALTLTSFTAQAQYAYSRVTPEQGVVQSPQDFLLSPEYQAAKGMERTGMTEFYVGLGIELLGVVIVSVPLLDITNSDLLTPSLIIGGLTSTAGAIVAIAGACKWYKGAMEIRDLRIEYSIQNGGVVVTF